MKTVIAILLGAALATTGATTASAGDDQKPAGTSAQGERMKACSKEAGDKHLKGDDRRHFMSECLKGHPKREEAREKRS